MYWVVTRTSDIKAANLDVEMIQWTQQIQMTLPAPKKRKTATQQTWSSSELPSFPILVNRKALEKHTQLVCYMAKDEKKSNDPKK